MTVTPHTSGPPRAQAQAVLTIDLGALVANWKRLRDLSAPAECAAVVKANAYGIGIEPAVKALAAAGCRTFFIAQLHEGVRVRAALGDAQGFRIFALNGFALGGEPFAECARHGIRPVIASLEQLQAWSRQFETDGPRIPVALQFNTGMNRLGIDASAAQDVLAIVKARRAEAHVDLVMSHFISSEESDDPLNARQIADFALVQKVFAGFRTSIANSSGIFLPQKPHGDLVRPGYALYGGNPSPGSSNSMQAVVHLHAPILQLRDVPAGATAGYNAQWTAQRPSRLATIGVGYADGIPRAAAAAPGKPGMQVAIHGTLCPVAGRISMDLIVIDVTDVPAHTLAPGAMVELLGAQVGIDDLAMRAGTIGYEILTGLGPRYHRVYRD